MHNFSAKFLAMIIAGLLLLTGGVFATPILQPTDGGVLFPEPVTELAVQSKWAHDMILLPLMGLVAFVVLALLLFIMLRFRKSKNPVPAKFTHNAMLEVIWTAIPVVILIFLAIVLLPIVKKQEEVLPADLTIKVTGRQWNWTYTYLDHGGFEYVSNELSKEESEARGLPYKLAVDFPMVVPAGKQIELLVTAAPGDVIHAFGSVSLMNKTDAIPGKINRLSFKIDEPKIIFGQCYELCGARHSFMPIQINVVTQAQFDDWVAQQQALAGLPVIQNDNRAMAQTGTAQMETGRHSKTVPRALE